MVKQDFNGEFLPETPQSVLETWLGRVGQLICPVEVREAIQAVLGDLVEAEQTSAADEERITYLEAERDALRAALREWREAESSPDCIACCTLDAALCDTAKPEPFSDAACGPRYAEPKG